MAERIRVAIVSEPHMADVSSQVHQSLQTFLKKHEISDSVELETREAGASGLSDFHHIVAFTDEPIVMQDIQNKLAPHASPLIKIHEWKANDRLSEKTSALVGQLKEEFRERKRQKNFNKIALQKLGKELAKERNMSNILEKKKK